MLPLGDGLGDRHVMVDEELLRRLCDYAQVSGEDTVLEIGAGTGNLTEALLERGCRVVAVEKDARFYDYLAQAFKGEGKLTLLGGDAVKIRLPAFNKVVSNMPYSISRKITERLLGEDFTVAVLVYQREFAQKLAARPGAVNYRFISVLAQSACKIEVLEDIPPEAFRPKPKVRSCAVKLSPGKKLGEDYVVFLKNLFNHKNKKIRNILDEAPAEYAEKKPVEMSSAEFSRLHSLI
ncbi:MAG: 16S rRNA (adenine(1518)-N(6)/adenine(1519)-N(6))-dimethyltransferase RsmA [Candidatus Altiarchaeota archaeon]